MAGLVVYALVNLRELGDATDAILRDNYRSIAACVEMSDAVDAQLALSSHASLGGELDQEAWVANEVAFARSLARARDNVTIPGEIQLLDRIDRAHHAYTLAGQPPESEAAARAHLIRVLPEVERLRAAITELREQNEAVMLAAGATAGRVATRSTWAMTLFGSLVFLMAGLVSPLAASRLVRPLRELVEATRNVIAGQYDVAVSVDRGDEIGLLAAEFNSMARRIAQHHADNVRRLRSEKQKSESILENIDDAIIVVDEPGLVIDINPAAARVLGTQPEAAGGQPLSEVLADDRVIALLRETCETGRAPVLAEGADMLTLGAEPERFHFLMSMRPIHAADTAPLALLVLRDVTRLKELDRLKSEFVATASHELRTPLTGIGMSLALLRENVAPRLDARERELLEVADEEVTRLKHLVAELLDVSKMEAGRIELSFRTTRLSELFNQVEKAFATQLADKSVTLTVDRACASSEVRVDATKIAWVLANLVGNALRYVARGGHIQLSARQTESRIEIAVADDGAGIPPENKSRIFDKFVSFEAGGGHSGTGLGLAICREIVRAHGGAIWVDSELGEGATFHFDVPLVER